MKSFRQFLPPAAATFMQSWFNGSKTDSMTSISESQSMHDKSQLPLSENANSRLPLSLRVSQQSYHKLFQSHKMEHGKS
jgi:hypothetical protein